MLHPEFKVLRLVPHFFREGSWPVAYDPVGGMQNQVWQMVRDLDSAGVAQTVVTSHIPGAARRQRLFARSELQAVGWAPPAMLAAYLLNFYWFCALIPYLARHLRRYDVVHLHLDHSIWCRLLASLIKLAPVPLVISLNVSLLSDGDGDPTLEGARLSLRDRLEQRALRVADRVVALSRHQAEMMHLLAPEKRAHVWIIPDAIDAAEFRLGISPADVTRFRATRRIPEGMPVVAYIGRISEEKGWRDIPEVAARLASRGIFFLVCGDGPCRAALERRLADSCPPGTWAVTGFVPRAEVKAALQVSRAIILSSRREAFGSILLEAMAHEVPAVAYRVGGIPDVAGEPAAIALVPPRRTDALADKVLELLADQAQHRSLVERGLARVRDFSVIAARDQLLLLYRGIRQADSRQQNVPAWR